MSQLTGPSWGPASEGAPKQLIVICHGVGANGHDLIHFAPSVGRFLPDAVFVAPDGPDASGQMSFGRQWFPINDLNPAVLARGVAKVSTLLNEFIDEQLAKYKLPATAYALMGFSQGAMTVLYTGLRRPHAPRAILAFSGALLAYESLPAEIKNHAPVLLGHGEMDHVLPATLSRVAATQLQTVNVPVETVYSPQLGHGIDETILDAGAAFLQKAFAA